MAQQILLGLHIIAGSAGLLLGAILMWWDTRRLRRDRPVSTGAGYAYQGTVLAVCLTAVGLIALHRNDLWWLVPVAVGTYGLALLGRRAARSRSGRWSHGYVHGQGGSFIALLTALIVVDLTVYGSLDGPAQLLPWLAPTAVGVPLIELWRRHLTGPALRAARQAEDRPRRSPAAAYSIPAARNSRS